MQTDAQRKATRKYGEKTMNFTIKYFVPDIKEGKRLKAYIADSHLSVNAYLKGLIKADLDNKGIPYKEGN